MGGLGRQVMTVLKGDDCVGGGAVVEAQAERA